MYICGFVSSLPFGVAPGMSGAQFNALKGNLVRTLTASEEDEPQIPRKWAFISPFSQPRRSAPECPSLVSLHVGSSGR